MEENDDENGKKNNGNNHNDKENIKKDTEYEDSDVDHSKEVIDDEDYAIYDRYGKRIRDNDYVSWDRMTQQQQYDLTLYRMGWFGLELSLLLRYT